MTETGIAIAEATRLLRLCAGKVLCPLPGPLSHGRRQEPLPQASLMCKYSMAIAPFSSVGAGMCLMFCVTTSSSYFRGHWRDLHPLVEAVGIGTVGLPQAVVRSHPSSKIALNVPGHSQIGGIWGKMFKCCLEANGKQISHLPELWMSKKEFKDNSKFANCLFKVITT